MSGEKTNFQYILRLLNTNVDGKQKIMYALTQIKGVGRRYSNLVCKKADVDLSKRYVRHQRQPATLQCLQSWMETQENDMSIDCGRKMVDTLFAPWMKILRWDARRGARLETLQRLARVIIKN